ncbi:MAG: hypothetical protein HY828_06285 [Actinobacteria bacterium]|nr:hypothetical protein [Actinomycetota bacterium]
MKFKRFGSLAAAIVLAATAAGCGSDDSSSATTPAVETTAAVVETTVPETTVPETTVPETTEASETTAGAPESLTLEAPAVTGFAVDGDAAEWADVPDLDLELEPIQGEDPEDKDAVLKVAHDDTNVYVLLQVEDDYNWDAADPHLSSALGIQWAIDATAGEGMGATDDDEETSLGAVDIWHWELVCDGATMSGGTTGKPAEGKDPGNDGACKLDDEWSTNPKEREDDNGDGAENSLSGRWSHSDPTADAAGMWTFEMSRPLDTADATDTVFTVGGTAKLAVAYWDADTTPAGWEDDGHVQSGYLGWIEVTFAA